MRGVSAAATGTRLVLVKRCGLCPLPGGTAGGERGRGGGSSGRRRSAGKCERHPKAWKERWGGKASSHPAAHWLAGVRAHWTAMTDGGSMTAPAS